MKSDKVRRQCQALQCEVATLAPPSGQNQKAALRVSGVHLLGVRVCGASLFLTRSTVNSTFPSQHKKVILIIAGYLCLKYAPINTTKGVFHL